MVRYFRPILVVAALLLAASPAMAVNTLQLYVDGATYNAATESWVTTAPTFQLGAYLVPDGDDGPGDLFYITAGINPAAAGTFGSFTFEGDTVQATAGMTFGTPALLPPHGTYPTYYYQYGGFGFTTDTNRFNPVDFNTSFTGGMATLVSNGAGSMYQRLFDVDISDLAAGVSLEFDLFTYNSGSNGKIKIEKAPFSHDASTHQVPEPATCNTKFITGSSL